MKTAEITPGVYFDGKKSLRKVISCTGDQVLFGKITVTPSPILVYGRPQQCQAAEFSRWAKVRLEEESLVEVVMSLRVRATHLNDAQEKALHAASQGKPVRGKVRTSLLEKELIACPVQSRGRPNLTKLGRQVLSALAKR